MNWLRLMGLFQASHRLESPVVIITTRKHIRAHTIYQILNNVQYSINVNRKGLLTTEPSLKDLMAGKNTNGCMTSHYSSTGRRVSNKRTALGQILVSCHIIQSPASTGPRQHAKPSWL